MGVSEHKWAGWVFVEAHKFWGYALFLSIIVALLELPSLYVTPTVQIRPVKGNYEGTRKQEVEAKKEKLAHLRVKRQIRQQVLKRRKVWKNLVIDTCDIFIPGFITGWYVLSSRTVGALSVVSSVLAGLDIWERVQRSLRDFM
jgi:hypothetical protein